MTTQNTHTRSIPKRLSALVSSERFFIAIVAIFVLQAAWIALSGRYPMAFDEDFHLGIIRLYAHHVSPFLSSQPAGADVYGAVVRDPSYLYQYLMSFPYRLVQIFTRDQTIVVICLRFINIALFAASLPLYRRLLRKLGASRALMHACLAVFVLIPVVPLLAAQINYDNLLLPLTALILLMTAEFSEELHLYRRINGKLLLLIVTLGMLASLVKYAFLPIMLVVLIYIAVRLRQTYSGGAGPKFLASLGFSFTLITRQTRWLLIGLFIIACALTIQRYGVNVARYHTPVPDCSAVLSTHECSAYGPWARDYHLANSKDAAATTSNPLTFSADWFYGMWLRTFFAVDGPSTNFQTKGPLIIPSLGSIIFISIGALCAGIYARRLFSLYNRRVLWLFGGVIAGYTGILWLDEYRSFLRTGQAVAINGRYLLPILPLFIGLCALGLNELLRRRQNVKLLVFAAALVCLIWGGGVLTYILRSNQAWYWPNSFVRGANHSVQHVIGPVTPGYHHPNEFMGRN